ncbi:MAG: transposase, partial [Rectinemataceae bacterium]|nr:transposase [Rectinemataceae bacterium]
MSRKVTLVEYRRGVCTKCGKEIRHPEAAGPVVEIGANLAAHLAMLRQAGVSYRKLSAFCTETLGIPLSPSGAMGVVSRVADRNIPIYETIGNVLSKQPVLHGDETGWKVRLEQWYVWIMCNRSLVYLLPDKSRSAKTPERLLGKDFEGIVVCDFYGAYNFLPKTQRCLLH